MRKRAVLVTAILVLGALAAVGAALTRDRGLRLDRVDGMRLDISEEITQAVRTEEEAPLELARRMLEESQRAEAPEEAGLWAELCLEHGGEERLFAIHRLGDRLYALEDNRCRELSPQLFQDLCEALGEELYRYADHPTLELEGLGLALDPVESSYAYRKLDGSYAPSPAAGAAGPPPTVTLEEGEWPYLSASLASSLRVEILDGEVEAFQGSWAGGREFRPSRAGEYTVRITADYDSGDYRGEAVYAFRADYPQAGIHFTVEGLPTYPGEAIVLRGHNIPGGESIQFASDIQFIPRFYQEGEREQIALFPISYYTVPGEYYVQLQCGEVTERFAVLVQDKEFQIQDLDVDEETTASTIDSGEANVEFENAIAPLRAISDGERHWEGGFVPPVEGGEITTEFGMIRYVNGSPTSTRHGAIDIALPRGARVGATNSGRVLYAGFLQLTGNTVVIEHGYGLKSWYYHMDSLSVDTGQMVGKGEKIGEVGSTGFSTGNHLHFALSVRNIFVNPDPILEGVLLPE